MSEANGIKFQSEKRRVALLTGFAAGVVDGNECRRQGGTPSKLRLVAINDDYSAGFRAGFFQRASKLPVDGDLSWSAHQNEDRRPDPGEHEGTFSSLVKYSR